MLRGLLLSALIAVPASAFPPGHGPFAPGLEPSRVPLSECPIAAEEGSSLVIGYGREVIVYGSAANVAPRLRAIVHDEYEAGIEVAVSNGRGRTVAGPMWVSDFPPNSRPDAAWCADLNGDRVIDFAVPLRSTGNGLGGEFHDLVIALSIGGTYRIWVVPTMDSGTEDFVRLGVAREPVVVKTTFVNNGEPDGPTRHSYWVYNLFAVRGGALVDADEIDSRFPKWVWFTVRPNHAAAALSPAERARVWALEDRSREKVREAK